MQDTIRRPLMCTAILVTALAAGSPTAAADMVLVADGQPRATIVVAKDTAAPARQKIRTAAEELQTYVRKISGATLPIVNDSQTPAGALILVGRSRLSDSLGVAIPGGVSAAAGRKVL